MSEYYEIGTRRLYLRLNSVYEAIDELVEKYKIDVNDLRVIKDRLADKEEEILGFGEALRVEYEKNKLCKELTGNDLFELKAIRDLNNSIDKALEKD